MKPIQKRVEALERADKGDDDTPLKAGILTEAGLKTRGDLRNALDYIAVHGVRL